MLQSVVLLALLAGLWNPIDSAEPGLRSASRGIHWFENRGQWPDDVHYGMRSGGAWIGAGPLGLVIHQTDPEDARSPHRLEVRFEGISSNVVVNGIEREPGLHHLYHGTDPNGWIRSVRTFRQVQMHGVHEGIDVVLREEAGQLACDIHLAPNADLGRLRLRVMGARSLRSQPDGSVVLETPLGDLPAPKVFVWRDGHDQRLPSQTRYGLVDETTLMLVSTGEPFVPQRASLSELATAPAPELVWSTYWGANDDDQAEDMALDSLGNVTIVGTVAGGEYLLSPHAFHATYDNFYDDVYVVQLQQATGALVYSARIGSSTVDSGQGVAVDALGRATVVGWVGQGGQGFPTTAGAFDPIKTNSGNTTAFALRLSPEGDQLEYSTYLEGTQASFSYAVDVGLSGAAVVLGVAGGGFPTTPGAFSSTNGQSSAATVTRLDPTGSFLEWSTYLTGERPQQIVLDSQETVYVVGHTRSLQFPATPGAFQTQLNTTLGQKDDCYVAHLTSDGASLIWATYLGGGDRDLATALSLLPNGDVVVAGLTESSDFPTTPGAFQEALVDDEDAFVARLDATGSSLIYSTLIGGISDDLALSVEADASGVVTAAGIAATAFPTTPGAFKTTIGGDAFVTRFSPDGRSLFYSTGVGGTWLDQAHALVERPDGLVTITGRLAGISSPQGGNFPITPNALIPEPLGGQTESFITTFWLLLEGVTLAGTSSPSCLGPVNANATTMPLAGQPFGLYCTQAPPDADGYLITFTGEFMPLIQPVKAGPEGFLESDLGNLPNTPGKLRRYRYAFRNTLTCPGQGAFSFSNLVVVQVQ